MTSRTGANPRADGHDLLALARAIPLRVTTTTYRLDDAHRAPRDLAGDLLVGAAVLVPTTAEHDDERGA